MAEQYVMPQTPIQIVKVKHDNAESTTSKGSIDFLISAAILAGAAIGGYVGLSYVVSSGLWNKIFGGLSASSIEESLSGLVPSLDEQANVTYSNAYPAAVIIDLDTEGSAITVPSREIDPLFGVQTYSNEAFIE